MLSPLPLAAAAAMGIVSVDSFARGWIGFLGVLGSGYLYLFQRMKLKLALARIFHYFTRLVFWFSLLALSFQLFCVTFQLGRTETEVMIYLGFVTVRLFMVLRTMPAEIDKIFSLS